MKMKSVLAILMIVGMIAGGAYAINGDGAGDGTGPIGDGDPDRVDWICTVDPVTGIETCVPPKDGSCQD